MPRLIAAVTGDNHLRPSTWAKHPELHSDAYVAFRQIIDFCIEHQVPLFLLGDLFDKARPDSESVGVYLHAMQRMEEARLPVYYVEGNHDKADPPWASLHPWATHIDGQTIEIGPFKFHGIDFTVAADLPARLAAIPPGIDFLCTHQSWEDIQPIGHVDGSFEMIPYGLVLLTGDFHVSKAYRGCAANSEAIVAYSPGSTAMQKLDEQPDKSFYLIHEDELTIPENRGGPHEITELKDLNPVPLKTRPFCGVTLATQSDFDAFMANTEGLYAAVSPNAATLPEVIRRPILRVQYSDAIPEAYTRLVAALGEQFHLFAEPQHITTETVVDVAATPEGAFDNLLTAVGELCDQGSDVYNGVRRLLESNDPKAEIGQMFEEYKQRHAQPSQPQQDAPGIPAGDVVGSPTE